MPLHPGKSKSVISKNISEMVAAGHPQNVAVAASLHNADKYAPGGIIGGAPGMGHMTALAPSPYLQNFSKTAAQSTPIQQSIPTHQGLFGSAMPQPPMQQQPPSGGGFFGGLHGLGGGLNIPMGNGVNPSAPQNSLLGPNGNAMAIRSRGSFRADGGSVEEYARGGKLFVMRQAHLKNHIPHYGGLFKSNVAGRTDKHNISVPKDSYILPADVVSGLGQGNTLAGAKTLDNLFPHSALQHQSPPTAPGVIGKFAKGGATHDMVPIVVAGGEYHLMPESVKHAGGGSVKHGNQVLDAFVKHIRKKTIKQMNALPGPK